MALNIGEKKTRLSELAKHRNEVCTTRHHEKSASLKLVQLAPRSFCHAVDGIWEQYAKFNFSRGELRKTSSKSAAPSAPLVSSPKHLQCSKEDYVGIKRWQSVAASLASDFCKSDHLQLSISHVWPFNVAKCCQRNSHDNGLNIWKKTRLSELAKHRNEVCKTRHHEKYASLKLVQLAPRSFCHAVDGIWEQYAKFNFSRGELRKTSSKSAAPSAPLVSSPKHLQCSKEDCGDKRMAICCRSSCKWLVQVRPFATVYFTFLACQCCQMLPKKQPWQWPLTFEKKKRVYPNWPNIATKFAKRGTNQSLLLSNWSSWRRAASATQWTEFDSNTPS